MAYLMTDVAAGGQAALKLQQSMAAAPYVEQEAAAVAEETQLKLQQERLKASYAPQMAAAKAEQDQLLLKDYRRKEVAAQVGYEADKESTSKLQQWMLTDEGKKASEADLIKKAAVFKLQAGLTEQGTKLMTQAEKLDAVDIANQAKRLAADDEAITKASIAIDAVPEGKEDEFINRLPPDSIKAAEARVGKENWAAYTGAEKKQVLSRLMLNTKTLAAEQRRAIDLKKTEIITQTRRDIATNHEDESTRRKELDIEAPKPAFSSLMISAFGLFCSISQTLSPVCPLKRKIALLLTIKISPFMTKGRPANISVAPKSVSSLVKRVCPSFTSTKVIIFFPYLFKPKNNTPSSCGSSTRISIVRKPNSPELYNTFPDTTPKMT